MSRTAGTTCLSGHLDSLVGAPWRWCGLMCNHWLGTGGGNFFSPHCKAWDFWSQIAANIFKIILFEKNKNRSNF